MLWHKIQLVLLTTGRRPKAVPSHLYQGCRIAVVTPTYRKQCSEESC